MKKITLILSLLIVLFLIGCGERNILVVRPLASVRMEFRTNSRFLPEQFTANVNLVGTNKSYQIPVGLDSDGKYRAKTSITLPNNNPVDFYVTINVSYEEEEHSYQYIGYGSYNPDTDSGSVKEIVVFIHDPSGEFADGTGTIANPYLIASPTHLNNVRNYLDAHFLQVNSINLGVAPWTENGGWNQISRFIDGGHPDNDPPFTGSYNGGNFTIRNMLIDMPTVRKCSLFGRTDGAVLENIHLRNVSVKGTGDSAGLVAIAGNTSIINCSITGVIVQGHAGLVDDLDAGSSVIDSYSTCDILSGSAGLVWLNSGTITNSYATGNVTMETISSENIGGLVSRNSGTISNSYATGIVRGGNKVGGLVGWNYGGTIINSYATGQVAGLAREAGYQGRTGGLVGKNENGIIDYCYALGAVEGGLYVGGLVGESTDLSGGGPGSMSSISRSYAKGSVKGESTSFLNQVFVGGLAGANSTSNITNCYATGNATGIGDFVGGLVGYLYISNLYPEYTVRNSYAIGKVTGNGIVGGLVADTNLAIPNVEYSYFNYITAGHDASRGGEPRTTEQMRYPFDINTYVGWDFTTIWDADASINNAYPYLR